MKALILAAGKGVRLKPLTDKVPKAMVPVNGRPLLEIVLARLAEAGCTSATLVVGYKKEAITRRFGAAFKGLRLTYVEQAEQLGTGHAILQAEGKIKGDFLCVNADVLVEPRLYKETWEKKGFDAVIAARESGEPWKYGCLKAEGNRVVDVVEKPPKGKEPSRLVGIGVYRLTPRIFTELKKVGKSERGEYEVTDAFKALARERKVGYVSYTGAHHDIGDLEGLKKAEKALKKK